MERNEEIEQKCVETLSTIFQNLGIEANLSIGEPRAKGFTIMIDTQEPGRLIGRGGVYLDSLQQLMNRILKKQTIKNELEQNYVYLVIASERPARNPEDRPARRSNNNDREVLDEDMKKIRLAALDRAKEVKKWGKSLCVGPYNAAQRRIVHLALRDDLSVETVSQEIDGEEEMKNVLITPIEVVADENQLNK